MIFALFALMGCAPSTSPWPPPTAIVRGDGPVIATGSSTLAAVDGVVYVVDEDAGALVRVTEAGAVDSIAVGVRPFRVAAAAGRLFVSLRGERGLAVVDAETFTLVGVLATGAEPSGVVATAG